MAIEISHRRCPVTPVSDFCTERILSLKQPSDLLRRSDTQPSQLSTDGPKNEKWQIRTAHLPGW
jgi:hypothetical protein